jgi:hypothetical protein
MIRSDHFFVKVLRRHIDLSKIIVMLLMIGFSHSATAQQTSGHTEFANLVGIWSGKADFMLPDGLTEQIHIFEFTSQKDAFLIGKHSWDITKKNLKSNDGREDTYQSIEPFLAVIAHDGTITLVEHGDHTRFRMRLLNRYTLDFIASEGGEHPVVGHGVLIREKLTIVE